jgi:hypothetical protein
MEFEFTTLVVIGTDCTGSFLIRTQVIIMEISHKSNFIGICSKSKIIVQFVHYKSCKIWRKLRYAEIVKIRKFLHDKYGVVPADKDSKIIVFVY